MPFSSGTFSRVHDWTTDRDAGIKISASRTDAEFDGIATGLTTCILKDGTQTLTAMIPFTLGLSVPTDKKIQLRDSAIFINSSGDGQLDVVADTEIELTAPTVDVAASTAVTIATPSLIITDNTTDEPIVQIKNTHNGTTAGELRFVMDKGAAGADGDDLGTISFYGDDAGQNQTAFAKIVGEVSEADDTDEAGKLSFFVAESDGTNTALTAGLNMGGREIILDADADTSITADTDDQIDIRIGCTDKLRVDSTGRLHIGTDGNLDRTRLLTQRTTGIGTSATVISSVGTVSSFGGHYFVTGRDADASANRFCDQLVVGTNGSVVVLHSSTVRGSPASRTYDNGSENLRLTMGSGNYTLQVFCVDQLTGG